MLVVCKPELQVTSETTFWKVIQDCVVSDVNFSFSCFIHHRYLYSASLVSY